MSAKTTLEVVKRGGKSLARLVDAKYSTRKAFGDAARLSPSDVSRFCSGKRTPPDHVVPQICAALGVKLPKMGLPPTVTKASERMIRYLEGALQLEGERCTQLELQVAQLVRENRTLHRRLAKIRDLTAGSDA